jgi:hypothetical protein
LLPSNNATTPVFFSYLSSILSWPS